MSDEECFEQAIEQVLADRSPGREVAGLSPAEQPMVRMAQLLHGSRGAEMAPESVERLRSRLFPRRVVPRRTAFLSGLGALMAGSAAGTGLDRAVPTTPSVPQGSMAGANARWYPIAPLADLPDGTIYPFTAGAVQGFFIYRNGRLWAVSRICTHMRCALRINRREGVFACPCHGAEFGLQDHFANPAE